ncbi:hypothetical protein [Neisseria lactamica]|nr:hypothetical protein [Neisseria lactamica]
MSYMPLVFYACMTVQGGCAAHIGMLRTGKCRLNIIQTAFGL